MVKRTCFTGVGVGVVLVQGLVVLELLANGSVAAVGEILQHGVLETLDRAISMQPTSDVTVVAARLLTRVVGASSAHARHVVGSGLVGRAAQVLLADSMSVAMQAHGCRLLSEAVSNDPSAVVALVDAGAIPALLRMVKNERTVDAGHVAAFSLLSALTRGSRKAARQMVDGSATTLIANHLRKAVVSVEVVEAAMGTLDVLLERRPQSVTAVLPASIVQRVLKAMRDNTVRACVRGHPVQASHYLCTDRPPTLSCTRRCT